MLQISTWIELYLNGLHEEFGERVWFVGLQGSYGRGEATQKSDIDLVVILDQLNAQDIQSYHNLLDTLPHRELTCGFFCGKQELFNWEPSDLFQLYYDTTPLFGSLDTLLDVIDDQAVERAIKIGACNVYHGCVHNMLYGKDEERLRGLYKAASFVVQAIAFKMTGKYVKHLTDLLNVVYGMDQKMIATFIGLKKGEKVEFASMSEALYEWAKMHIS